jgi:hypothetical protein
MDSGFRRNDDSGDVRTWRRNDGFIVVPAYSAMATSPPSRRKPGPSRYESSPDAMDYGFSRK